MPRDKRIWDRELAKKEKEQPIMSDPDKTYQQFLLHRQNFNSSNAEYLNLLGDRCNQLYTEAKKLEEELAFAEQRIDELEREI